MPDIQISSNAVIVYVLRKTEKDTEILFLKRSKKDGLDNFWLHVAGKIEGSETGWQAALRELKEETGLDPRAFYTANHCEQFYSVSNDKIVILPMFVAFVDKKDCVTLNDEHSEYKWFSLEEARQVVPFNNQRECLRVIEQGFIRSEPPEFLRIKI